MASQAHGEPNRANTPTDSQKKKKKKLTQNQKSNLPTVPMVTSLAEKAEKTKPQYIDTVHTEQKQNKPKPILCLSKKKTQYRASVPKRQNQTKKTPNPKYSLVVAVFVPCHRFRRL